MRKNYGALVSEFGSDQFKNWPDVTWMYRALSDADDAARLMAAASPTQKIEDGNTRANAAHWIAALQTLGPPQRAVTADHPLAAVFQNGALRSYVAYNMRAKPLMVTFSDGHQLVVPAKGWADNRAGGIGPDRSGVRKN